jgi:hypothetical protein
VIWMSSNSSLLGQQYETDLTRHAPVLPRHTWSVWMSSGVLLAFGKPEGILPNRVHAIHQGTIQIE